jgi:uncharacterized protein (UPF0297 family)
MDADSGVKELEEKREEECLQYPRVVGVLSSIISSHNKVLVYGSRDVGKSLYVRLAVLDLAYQLSAACGKKPEQKEELREEKQGQDERKQKEKKQYLPVFLQCPITADVVLRLANLARFHTENIPLLPHYDMEPIIVLDDAHLCSDEDLVRIGSQLPDKARLVLIAPSAAIGGLPEFRKSDYNSIKVLPLRFVEVAEIMNENIRNFLREKHLEGRERIENLSNAERVHELLKNLRESLNRDGYASLMQLFRCYLICGGTAHGIKCVNDCKNNREIKGFSHTSFKTVEEILEDARVYGRYYGGIDYTLFQVALQAVMMYFAEKVMKEGLETNQGNLQEEVNDKAREISLWWNIGWRHEDLRNAVLNATRYLDDSGVIIGIKHYTKQDMVKYVFTDPRYLIGAYLYHTHMVGNKEYPSAFDEALKAIDNLIPTEPKQQAQKKPETKDLSAELGHYLEAITLSNLALGAYAMSVSYGRPEKDRPPLSKYIKYVKTDCYEIDALIKIGYSDEKRGKVNLGILFEVSRSFDEEHVNKCKRALDDIRKTLKDVNDLYCIYAMLDEDKVDFRDGKVIVAPLPLALLLF